MLRFIQYRSSKFFNLSSALQSFLPACNVSNYRIDNRMHASFTFACGNMMTLNVLWMTLRKLISLHRNERLEQLLTACKIDTQKNPSNPETVSGIPSKSPKRAVLLRFRFSFFEMQCSYRNMSQQNRKMYRSVGAFTTA